jgi:MFS family permease
MRVLAAGRAFISARYLSNVDPMRDRPSTVRSRATRAITPSRAMPALFTSAALINAAMASASAVSTIVAADRLGARWSGLPNTAAIIGTGVGALALTRVMNRWGRRAGLLLGYLAAMAGGFVAALAVAGAAVAYLSCGMLLLGLGNAGAQLSRYVAAELYPPQRHGFAIGAVVWAGTFGAVGGPLLLAPSARLAATFGWIALTGPFLLALLDGGLAALAAVGAPTARTQAAEGTAPLWELMLTPPARAALAVMGTAQVAMVVVMTATPLDMHLHGQGLGPVGTALSVHTLGMFALSPATGRLVDRVGPQPVMLAGLLTLAVAAALTAAGHQPVSRTAGLFLLGYGWNLCFIGGTGRLTRGLAATERARVEGAVDAAVWSLAAAGSIASTAMLSSGGYPLLAAVTAVLVLIPVILLRGRQPEQGVM